MVASSVRNDFCASYYKKADNHFLPADYSLPLSEELLLLYLTRIIAMQYFYNSFSSSTWQVGYRQKYLCSKSSIFVYFLVQSSQVLSGTTKVFESSNIAFPLYLGTKFFFVYQKLYELKRIILTIIIFEAIHFTKRDSYNIRY